MLFTDSEQSFNIIIIGIVFLFIILLQVPAFNKNVKNIWKNLSNNINNLINLSHKHPDITFLIVILLSIIILYYKNIISSNIKYLFNNLMNKVGYVSGGNIENFELNILDDSVLKNQLDINENNGRKLLDEYHQKQVVELSSVINPSENGNKNNRGKKAFNLLHEQLRTVAYSLNIMAAERGLIEFKNDKDMITRVMTYTQDEFLTDIFKEIYNDIFSRINSNDERFINNSDMSLNEEFTKKYIVDILDKTIKRIKVEYLTENMNKGTIEEAYVNFNDIKNKVLVEKSKVPSNINIDNLTNSTEINILDALDINTTDKIRDLYKKFKPYAKAFKDIGFDGINKHFQSYSDIVVASEDYINVSDYSDNNKENLNKLYGELDNKKKEYESINQKNAEQNDKLDKLNKLLEKVNNTFAIFSPFIDKFKNDKEFNDIFGVDVETFLINIFFGNDNTNYKLKDIAPELFLTNAEIEQKLEKLEKIREQEKLKVSVPNTTDINIDSGIIEPDLNLPQGYFKLGYIDKNNSNKTLFLTLTNEARTTVSTDSPVSLSVKLSNPGGDNFKEQLWYTDKLGRIFNMKNSFCLTVETIIDMNNIDNIEPKVNDVIYATRANKEELPLQRFEFNKDFTTLKLLKTPQNSSNKDLFLSVSNNDLVRLNEFNNNINQVNWFVELTGDVKEQKSIFSSEYLTRENTRDVLVIDNNNLPPYSKFTYSFWIYVKENASQDIGRRPVFIKGNVINNNLNIVEKYQNMTNNSNNANSEESEEREQKYYRSPGVFIETEPDYFNMDVVLSTNVKLNEKFNVINKETLKLNSWNHISIILDNKELKIFINGNLDSTHNILGTPFNNEYPLYITPSGGFAGKLHYMRYYNYARTDTEVKKDLTETAPPDLQVSNIPVETYVAKPDQFKPIENLNHPDSSTLHSSFGWLPNISSLYNIEEVRKTIYLQANFQSIDGSLKDYYKVDKILLQGHSTKNAYVKQFKLMYFDYYDNDWRYYNNGEIFPGNTNNFDIKETAVNILTNKIRILPQDWNMNNSTHLLGIRVGFNGQNHSPDRCDKKISMCDVDRMLKERESAFDMLSKKMDESVDKGNLHEIEHQELINKIDRIQLELNKSRMKTLLYKNGKCSDASAKSLPDTVYASENINSEKKCSINLADYDIREHPDFNKYLNNKKMEKLCNHLMTVAPNKYDSIESCINIMTENIDKYKHITKEDVNRIEDKLENKKTKKKCKK